MPIYKVETPDGILNIEGPAGASDDQLISFAAAHYYGQQKEEEPAPQAPAAPKDRTWGEAFGDVGASLASGVGQLAQMPGQIGMLAGAYRPDQQNEGLQGLGKQLEQYGQSKKSDILLQKERARSAKVGKAEGIVDEFMTSIAETAKDPALMTSFFAEQVPNLIGSMGAGLLTKGAVRVALRGATEQVLEKSAVRGMVGANAAMQGADVGTDTFDATYERLVAQGVPPQKAAETALGQARVAAVEAAAISVGTQYLPGGQTVERALVGRGLPRAGGLAKGLLGEAVSEGLEEGGGQFVSNVQQAETAPGMDIYKGVGEAAGMGALMGGVFGGAAGATLRGQPSTPAGETPTGEPVTPVGAPEGGETEAERIKREEIEREKAAGIAPTEPTAAPVEPTAPTGEPTVAPVAPTAAPTEPTAEPTTEPVAPVATPPAGEPLDSVALAKQFTRPDGTIDYEGFGHTLGQVVYGIISKGNAVVAYVNGEPRRIIRADGSDLIDENGVRISPVNFGGFATEGNRIEFMPAEAVKPTEPNEPTGEPQAPAGVAPAPTYPTMPFGMHPAEATGFEGSEQVRQQAVDHARSEGIEYNFDGDGKIKPRDSRLDWNVLATKKTGKQLLEAIYNHVPVDYQHMIGRILPTVAKTKIEVQKRKVGWNGSYSPYGDTASFALKSDVGNTFDVIVHELMHAATVTNYLEGLQHRNSPYRQAAIEMEDLAKTLSRLGKNHQALWFIQPGGYAKAQWGMELIARAMTNRDVQAALKQIKISGKTSGWNKFVGTVRKLLGLDPKDESALTRVLDLTDQLIAKSRKRGINSSKDLTIESRDQSAAPVEEAAPIEDQPAPQQEATQSRHKTIFGKSVTPEWQLKEPAAGFKGWLGEKVENRIFEFVDKFVDLKRVIQAINSTNKQLDATWDAYRRETLYHNRAAYLTSQFLKNELKPLAQDMVNKGVSEEELNDYLLARHAGEYNVSINQRNDDPMLLNRGSGIHTIVATAYLKGVTNADIAAIEQWMASRDMQLNPSERKLLEASAKMSETKRNNLTALANRVDNMVKRTQEMSVAGGLEKQSTIDYWRDKYPNYVPLKRNPDELDFIEKNMGSGQGFSTRAGISKGATGSLKTVDNILANVILQRDMAIVRSEKARIGRALYAMALSHPNPNFWLPVNPNASVISKANKLFVEIQRNIDKWNKLNERIKEDRAAGHEPDPNDLRQAAELARQIKADQGRHEDLQKQADQAKARMEQELTQMGVDPETIKNMIREPEGSWYNPTTGKVEYRTNSYLRNSANVVSVPIDGETRYIFFNPGDPRAKRLAMTLKESNVPEMGWITATIGRGTRWISQVNTQFNPFFGVINMMRDVQGAQFNLSSTPLRGHQLAVDKNILGSALTIMRSLRSDRAGGESKGEFSKEWDEFQRLGGPTGIKDLLANNKRDMSVLAQEISKMQDPKTPKEVAARIFSKTITPLGNMLSDFNDTMENAVRLAAFIEAKKVFGKNHSADIAAEKAAELAKNLTVNFNRKGQKSQLVNSWFAFFNAAAQGTARLVETMKGPAGKKIVGSLVMLGVMQQFILASAGFKDDDPPEFVREKNFVIPTGDGKYVSWPYPLGLNAFVNVGRIGTAAFMDGGKNTSKYVADMASVISNSFNPFGSSGLSMQTLAPTVADPFAALDANRDAFGRPIYKEDRATKPVPGYLRTREGASKVSKEVAEFLNKATGGTDYKKGFISPTGDQIDYLAGQITGGTGREAAKIQQYISNEINGEETAPYRVPFVGRFKGDTGSAASIRNSFYQNVTEASAHEDEIKGRATHHQEYQSYLKEHPEAKLYGAANTIENEITQLNKTRAKLIEMGAPKAQIKQIEETKSRLMKQFNDMYDKAKS